MVLWHGYQGTVMQQKYCHIKSEVHLLHYNILDRNHKQMLQGC